jgi:hypothetical protein
VLLETEDGIGHSAHYARVRVEGTHAPGQIVQAKVYDVGAENTLQAQKQR